MADPDRPIALEAYEALADGYAAKAETKAENGYNEHPAIRRVIGAVTGLDVLDAGCGPGFLTRDLIAAGASRIAAFDVSPRMVELARERNGPETPIIAADMAKPLDWLADASFDLVVSSLALDYVRDWSKPLGEFRRVLKPGGRLVFSVQHPLGSYLWFRPETAFGVHYCEASWRSFTEEPVIVPDYYRSFEEIVGPLLSAGFALAGVHETRPVPELEQIDPEKYRRHSTIPTFMVIEALRQ
ncbi:MAG: class I SAM-dependent methyltransferase [Erythrobacter sp.]|uniref:class I SAM-dependent methyltransferase n=1 Tax=Erythrobacter sp. TaxID=1042 RepID=UPI002629DC7E|nr:class I SAM-dependent methyltransferase [Erythrobacter sp.]MDJ0978275.1 class I SAM-dependent methyltransferase [Erythrobacter sp.]